MNLTYLFIPNKAHSSYNNIYVVNSFVLLRVDISRSVHESR